MASTRDYLYKALDTYKNARAEWVKLRDERDAIIEAARVSEQNKALTAAAKRDNAIRFKDEIRAKTHEMHAVNAAMNKELSTVRAEMDQRFYSVFHPTPEEFDMKGQAVIQSGILSIDELMEYAKRYEDNKTMCRMIGIELEKRLKNNHTINAERAREIKSTAIGLKHDRTQSEEQLQAFDNMADYFNRATGGLRKSGADYSDTADKFAQIIEAEGQAAIENCKNITVSD